MGQPLAAGPVRPEPASSHEDHGRHHNGLVRALGQDYPEQARAASALLEQAELVAIPLPVLCELVWVLRRVYGFTRADCMGAIEALMASQSVVAD